VLRPWRYGDEPALAREANDREIWRALRDRIPHPYPQDAAAMWVASTLGVDPPQHLAIEVDGEVAGGVGLYRGDDVHRYSAEVGYWLGRRHWGRGIATEALTAFTAWAFTTFDLGRLYASAFATNPASGRVLAKAGYRLEGIARAGAFKDGRFVDVAVYARLRTD